MMVLIKETELSFLPMMLTLYGTYNNIHYHLQKDVNAIYDNNMLWSWNLEAAFILVLFFYEAAYNMIKLHAFLVGFIHS